MTMPTTARPTPINPKTSARSALTAAPSPFASSALHHEMTMTTKPRIVSPIPHCAPRRSGFAPPPVTLSLPTSASNCDKRDVDIVPLASVFSSFMTRDSSSRWVGRRGRVIGAKIRVGELARDACRGARVQEPAVQHDPGAVGEPEDLVRELLDDQDRQ